LAEGWTGPLAALAVCGLAAELLEVPAPGFAPAAEPLPAEAPAPDGFSNFGSGLGCFSGLLADGVSAIVSTPYQKPRKPPYRIISARNLSAYLDWSHQKELPHLWGLILTPSNLEGLGRENPVTLN
jgi:hypothetical protein